MNYNKLKKLTNKLTEKTFSQSWSGKSGETCFSKKLKQCNLFKELYMSISNQNMQIKEKNELVGGIFVLISASSLSVFLKLQYSPKKNLTKGKRIKILSPKQILNGFLLLFLEFEMEWWI